MMHSLACGGFVLELDNKGGWRCLRHSRGEVAFTGLAPRVMLAGQPASIQTVSGSDGGLALALASDGCSGVFRMWPQGDAIRCAIEIEDGDPYDLVQIELPLPPPPGSALHIPTANNFGHVIDADSPVGRENGIELRGRRWQFCAAELEGVVLAFIGHSTLERIPRHSFGTPWRAGGCVAEGALWFQMACLNGMPWEVALYDTLDAAIRRYHAHLIADYGAIPWRDDPTVPDWFAHLKMVVTLDLYRSNGDIAHTYGHVRDLCREMKAAGMGGGVLFYLPGHNNRYDAGFPLYGPCDALGGEAGFREMVTAIHDAGHRVMPHVCIWGADPYQPFFEQIEDLAVPWSELEEIPNGQLGPYAAWSGFQPVLSLDYDSGEVPMHAQVAETSAVFETPEIPTELTACLAVAGVKDFAKGRLHAVLHDRVVSSRPGEFAAGGSCCFRFRLRFEPGVNRIRLDFEGGRPDLTKATFRIFDALHPPEGDSLTRASVWTHAFVRMDIKHPRWIQIVRDQLVELINNYDVDAIHLDAAVIDTRDKLPIYQALREALPRTLFGCEYLAELNYFLYHISQGGSVPEAGSHRATDLSHRLTEPFLKFYYHLCAADAFVPVATVCDHQPVPEKMPEWRRERVKRMWYEGPKWHVLPNIRLNYRDYGLDLRTREAFFEVLGSSPLSA